MDDEADFARSGIGPRPLVKLIRNLSATLAAEGRTLSFWLRDDDAVAPSPALDRLLTLTARRRVPLLLAVIPKRAGAMLADRLAHEEHVTPCQHGFSHRNHATAGERAMELGLHRPSSLVLGEIAEGQSKLQALFGERSRPILVPPWNRIDDGLLPSLPELGIRAISRFGRVAQSQSGPVREINATLDIIDWKQGKRGRTIAELAARMEADVETATEREVLIGVLTHHLDHDERAWSFLTQLFEAVAETPQTRWLGVDDVLEGPKR